MERHAAHLHHHHGSSKARDMTSGPILAQLVLFAVPQLLGHIFQLLYSMVDTLCEMDDINAVRFYVEGLSAETLAGGIYLKSPLMPNPGIVIENDGGGEP